MEEKVKLFTVMHTTNTNQTSGKSHRLFNSWQLKCYVHHFFLILQLYGPKPILKLREESASAQQLVSHPDPVLVPQVKITRTDGCLTHSKIKALEIYKLTKEFQSKPRLNQRFPAPGLWKDFVTAFSEQICNGTQFSCFSYCMAGPGCRRQSQTK